jgi:signal transduction histidine kinase
MGLRWRWTLVLAAAAVGLMLVVGLGVESTLRARIGVESREYHETQRHRLQLNLESALATLEIVLDELVDSGDLASTFSSSEPTDAQLRAREDWVVVTAQREGIDELLVLDNVGRVLACSAHPERVGQIHPGAEDLRFFLPRSGLIWREYVEASPAESSWRLSAVRDTLLPAGRVRLLTSTVLDGDPLRRLGAELGLASLRWGPPRGDEVLFVFPLGIQTVSGAHLSFSVGAAPDIRALRSLRIWLLAAVGLALLMGFIGAPWIAAGFGRPLEEMSHEMERIGRGARSIDLEPAGPPEVRQLQSALRQLVTDLRQTEERVRQAERQATWREFARHIAHEIRNVLSPLALALDNVETGVDRDRGTLDASLAVARDQLESLRRLASEFSDHARQPELRWSLLVIEDLLDSVVQTARAAFAGVEIAVERIDPPDSVDGDAEQLRRAVHNLIKNAVEAGGEAVMELRCGAGSEESTWWIEVVDHGPGLPPEVERSLGEPQVSSRDGGSGLGLAIVSRVAAAHGGELLVTRPAGGGTAMRMILNKRPPGQIRTGTKGVIG